MRFPDKKDELLEKLINEKTIQSKDNPAALATKVKIMEVWFKYYQPSGGGQQALLDIQMIQQGQMPQVPQQIDQEYAGAIAQFMESPEFSQLPPEVQQAALQYAQQVQQALAQMEQQQSSQAFNAPTNFGRPAGGQLPGQAQNPSAENTANVPINPPTGPAEASPRNV